MRIESGSVVIALSNYTKSKGYIDKAIQNLQELKKARAKHFHDVDLEKPKTSLERDYEEFYLNPLKYHIFGNYDFAFIMLTENITLTNKVFLPTRINKEEKLGSLKTSVLSGIPIQCSDNKIEDTFRTLLDKNNKNKYPFISISNLKLNNTFLIGNGYHFIEKVRKKIENILCDSSDMKYMLVDSFASFELTLLVFSSKIEKEKLLNIRSLNVKALFEGEDNNELNELFENSLLSLNKKDINFETASHLHVFADTQSFYGIGLTKKNDTDIYEWVVNEEDFENEEINLKTTIEWEVKPGHEYYVSKTLKDIFDKDKDEKEIIKPEFIHGQTDFDFNIKNSTLKTNYDIYNELRIKDKNGEIRESEDDIKHIRNVKTKIYLDASHHCNVKPDPIELHNYSDIITKKMALSLTEINEIREQLKILKISRELRNRVIKLFYNYNSAVRNPNMYNLFLDLHFFVKDLKIRIGKWSKGVEDFLDGTNFEKQESVNSIVDKINVFLKNFEDAFNLRYINNYLYEGVNDFQINYNSPLQELISAFDNYFKALYSCIDKNDEDETARKLITRVNEMRTTTDFNSVNFSIYNLYEPGILFYCATKEIYNFLFKNDKYGKIHKNNNEAFKIYCDEYFKNNPNSRALYLQSNLKKYDLEYLLTDFLRFIYFFNGDFKFITFWHLSFIAQLPSCYETSGTFNDEQTFKEVFRLLFLAILSDYVIQIDGDNKINIKTVPPLKRNQPGENEKFLKDNCPFPELKDLWYKYFDHLTEFIHDLIISKDAKFKIVESDIESKSKKVDASEKIKDKSTFFESFIEICLSVNKREGDKIPIKHVSIDMIDIDEDYYKIFIDTNENGFDFMEYVNRNRVKIRELKDFVYRLTYSYLRHVYEISAKPTFKIPYLRRDWKTGSPVTDNRNNGAKIINGNDKNYFAFDSSGSVFFYKFQKAKEFSKFRNRCFLALIHTSHILKKRIIEQVIEENRET